MNKFDELKIQCSRLEGVRSVLVSQKASLISEISQAQSYLDTKDEVLSVLTNVQEATQAKTKDLFENLLGSLITEVMGDRDENAKVVLSSVSKNNKVSLSVEIENGAGERRDVYLDKGGSVKNIIAMGLRFIALSRTKNRRFIVLDEADCWLNERYIPGFAGLLHDLSCKIGMQVVYISHHSPEHFLGKAKVINLTSVNGMICSEEIEHIASPQSDAAFDNKLDDNDVDDLLDGVGIRYLRLMNFKQHENTIIELSPNVTVITGDNDIGKTTVVQAIEAVARNNGREGLIRDGMASCKVEIGIEDGFCLEWGYKRKGSNKSHYLLTDHNNVRIKESKSGTVSPEWLDEYLCMPLHKDIDINIGDQDSANFILDKSISGFKKAEILSLGTDASKIQKLITRHGENVLNYTKLINSKKKGLLAVKNQLSSLNLLNPLVEKLEQCGSIEQSINENNARLASMANICNRFFDLSKTSAMLEPIRNVPIMQLNAQADAAVELEQIISSIDRLNAVSEALSQIKYAKPIEPLALVNTNEILGLAVRLKSLSQEQVILQRVGQVCISPPAMIDSSVAERLGVSISKRTSEINELNTSIFNHKQHISSIMEEKAILIDELGHQCPLCKSNITELAYEAV
jgi:hypothetical protein